ncbi:hypothetical protein [Streptomyces sp. NPDC002265]|uniref:hypothetical protein n=1 Tax=Streptomyces sp. NPDC002265 TaxID=3154415 RepID=UPI003331B6FB
MTRTATAAKVVSGPIQQDISSTALEKAALEIETLRIEIIGMLVTLAIEIAVDLAMAPFTFGASEAAIPVQMAATRVVTVTLIRKTLIRPATHKADSELQQVSWALLAQLVEMGKHERGSIDSSELARSAISGAVGGAVGFGAGSLGASALPDRVLLSSGEDGDRPD